VEERISKIIKSLQDKKDLSEKDIDEVLNNIDYVSICGFTNNISHLTLFGKRQAVEFHKERILEELHKKVYIDTPLPKGSGFLERS